MKKQSAKKRTKQQRCRAIEMLKRHHDRAYEALYTSWSQANTEFWDAEWTISCFSERVKPYGICISDVNFMGFGSQGDGASFDATVTPSDALFESLPDYIECLDTPYVAIIHALQDNGWLDDVAINREGNRYYYPKNMMTVDRVDFYDNLDPGNLYQAEDSILETGMYAGMNVRHAMSAFTEDNIDEYTDWVLDICRIYADELYMELEEDYEWNTSYDRFDDYLEDIQWVYHAEDDTIEVRG